MSHEEIIDLVREINADDSRKAVAYIAGGGTEVLPMLLANGGGSATLLSARIPYDPNDFRAALGYDPGRLVDGRAARGLAMAAFRHALKVRGDFPPEQVFGIGSTSKLSRGEGEREGRSHEIHAALQTCDRTRLWSLILPEACDRIWEERINSLLLLNLFASGKEIGKRLPLEHEGRSVSDDSLRHHSADSREFLLPYLPDLITERRAWIACDFAGGVNLRQASADAGSPRLLLPGSFRPLHAGHIAMAKAASTMTGLPIGYEISLFHPEKPPLDYIAIRSRLKGFAGHSCRLYLTNAPTFLEKAHLFPGCTFAVGHDTALRIVDPRFYGGSDGRDAMLRELESLGTRFLVFGRVDASGTFRDFSHEEFEHPLSGFLSRLVTPIPGHVFRVDLSSTEIREQSGDDFA